MGRLRIGVSAVAVAAACWSVAVAQTPPPAPPPPAMPVFRTVTPAPLPPPPVAPPSQAPAKATDPPSELILAPRWAAQPKAADFDLHYPARAWERGRAGDVELLCQVVRRGALACSIVREEPADMQFGAAALRIAEAFRMAEVDMEGRATAGRRLRLPITFRPAKPD